MSTSQSAACANEHDWDDVAALTGAFGSSMHRKRVHTDLWATVVPSLGCLHWIWSWMTNSHFTFNFNAQRKERESWEGLIENFQLLKNEFCRVKFCKWSRILNVPKSQQATTRTHTYPNYWTNSSICSLPLLLLVSKQLVQQMLMVIMSAGGGGGGILWGVH